MPLPLPSTPSAPPEQVFSRGAKFSLFKPAEEMVYIGLDDESRTKGKAAIDVVGAQSGKSIGSVLQQALLILRCAGAGGAGWRLARAAGRRDLTCVEPAPAAHPPTRTPTRFRSGGTLGGILPLLAIFYAAMLRSWNGAVDDLAEHYDPSHAHRMSVAGSLDEDDLAGAAPAPDGPGAGAQSWRQPAPAR